VSHPLFHLHTERLIQPFQIALATMNITELCPLNTVRLFTCSCKRSYSIRGLFLFSVKVKTTVKNLLFNSNSTYANTYYIWCFLN